jgi:hypothetical protein
MGISLPMVDGDTIECAEKRVRLKHEGAKCAAPEACHPKIIDDSVSQRLGHHKSCLVQRLLKNNFSIASTRRVCGSADVSCRYKSFEIRYFHLVRMQLMAVDSRVLKAKIFNLGLNCGGGAARRLGEQCLCLAGRETQRLFCGIK